MKLWEHRYVQASRKAKRVLADLRPADVRSIAVVKHGGLGDMVLTRPFCVTLRKHFPNAAITFSAIANYMNGVPEDLVHRVHVSAGKTRPRPPFRERMRRYRELGYHDLLFDITASSDSFWLTWLNPAGLKVGFRHRLAGRLLYDVAIPRAFMKFEAECFLDLLGILRIPYDWPLDFGYPPAPPYEGPPYLAYFPTASVPERCWPVERYGELMGRLAADLPQYEHRLIYGMGEWEQAAGDVALGLAGDRDNVKAVRDVTGEAFVDILRQATLVVGNNSGSRNLAITLGTPTLGVFPDTLAFTYLPRFGHHVVVHDLEATQPEVEKVYRAARDLLERIEASHRSSR